MYIYSRRSLVKSKESSKQYCIQSISRRMPCLVASFAGLQITETMVTTLGRSSSGMQEFIAVIWEKTVDLIVKNSTEPQKAIIVGKKSHRAPRKDWISISFLRMAFLPSP